MYGQMTAGSWIYIGTQGIVQGTYETFAAVAEKRFGGTLAGTSTLTGGCGGMGGAQPLAVTMNEGVCLIVDVDRTRLGSAGSSTATSTRSPTTSTPRSTGRDRPRPIALPASIGVVGNCAEVFPVLLRRGVAIDVVTDQTSAHDPLSLSPRGSAWRTGPTMRRPSPRSSPTGRRASMAEHVQAMVEFQDAGAEVFDYGNSIRDEARQGGYERAFDFPGFRAGLHPTAVLRGKGAVSLGGAVRRPEDIDAHRSRRAGALSGQRPAAEWMRWRQGADCFQGLPARICWLGYGERDRAGEASTTWSPR